MVTERREESLLFPLNPTRKHHDVQSPGINCKGKKDPVYPMMPTQTGAMCPKTLFHHHPWASYVTAGVRRGAVDFLSGPGVIWHIHFSQQGAAQVTVALNTAYVSRSWLCLVLLCLYSMTSVWRMSLMVPVASFLSVSSPTS